MLASLVQNIIYTCLCINNECGQKNLVCEIFIHVIYITMYMTVPIAIILVSISRTCLITINLKKRFRTSHQQQSGTDMSMSIKLDTVGHCHSTTVTSRLSNSMISSPSSTTTTSALHANTSNRLARSRRRRSRIDAQMVVLISINVAPFILVHIITEIAYLFEKYSTLVAQSTFARLMIIFIYLSWYLISATRFYTNCLLSRIYREEFRNRLYMLRTSCTPRALANNRASLRRPSSRYFMGGESTTINFKSIVVIN